jgi:polar amino acid transport system substrate-binding protein
MSYKQCCQLGGTSKAAGKFSAAGPLVFGMRKRARNLRFGAMACVALLMAAAGPSVSYSQEASAQGPMLCSTDAGFVPFSYTNSEGKLEGFQIELFNEVARRLGRELQITSMPHAGEAAAIMAGRFQFSCGNMTITKERAEHMLFTEPYISVSWRFAIKKGSAPITSEDDLRGKVVAINAGSVPAEVWLAKNAERLNITIMQFPGQSEAIQAVLQGRAYAYYNSNIPVEYVAKTVPQLEASWVSPGATQVWSSPFGPDQKQLRDEVGDALVCMKRAGFIAKLYEKYLGVPPQDGSATVTAYPGYGMEGFAGFEDRPQNPDCKD